MVLGNVIHTEPKDMYISRVATINAGLPKETPALTLNRLCGSGLQAIVSAAQAIKLGDADVAVGGGAESMSRGGYVLPTERWGARMGNAEVMDMMVGALTDPFDTVHMGITAENVAAKWGISRQQQDELAVESNKRAINAIEKGYFKEQILPIELKGRKGPVMVDTDEHPRADASMDGMAKLRTVFQKDGTVTAGNASGINDGASAVVLMERKAAERKGLKPMARLVAYAHAGVDPKYMGIGPVPAVKKALERAGLRDPGHGRDRVERGLRRAGLRRGQGSRLRPEEGQPQRRRHRAGPPDRRDRQHPHRQGDLRAAAHRRALRAGHHVHRRRPGHRGGLRAAVDGHGSDVARDAERSYAGSRASGARGAEQARRAMRFAPPVAHA